MKKSINIGIGTDIDLENLLESRMLIQANSGGGKSGIVRVMMEEVYGSLPFIAFDKAGEYYTLKEKYPDIIIIGGRFQDMPLNKHSGTALAKLIIKNGLTVIIDLSSLEDDMERSIYVKNFLNGLLNIGQQYWTGYLVFLEEAHVFCGQQEKLPSASPVKKLMSEGRKMGFCGILVTQRIAKLHKDAAAECNNKFIGRTFQDIDMRRSANELGINIKEGLKLRELKRQHFWAFGTSIEPHQVHEVIIKDAQTSFPKAGSMMFKPQKATSKIMALIAELSKIPASHAKKSDLENESEEPMRASPVSAPLKIEDSEKVKKIKQQLQEVNKKNDQQATQLQQRAQHIKKMWTIVEDLTKFASATFNKVEALKKEYEEGAKIKVAVNGERNKSVKFEGGEVAATNGKLPGGMGAIFTACAQTKNGATREQLTILTGYKRSSRDVFIGKLKMAGYVTQEGERIVADLQAVKEILGDDFKRLPTGEKLREHWLKHLTGGEQKIFQVIISHHPVAVSRDTISDETDYKRSSRDVFIGKLIARELIEVPGTGFVKASPHLYT